MIVHFALPDVQARAITRITDGLTLHAPPNVTVSLDPRAADLVIVPVVGRRDKVADDTDRYRRRGQRYAVLQLVLRSSQKPSAADWVDIWGRAAVVLSYLDLPALCAEDGVVAQFPFYHTALGVDPHVFQPRLVPKRFIIATSGHGWLTESVRECVVAARAVHRTVFHLGRELHRPDVECGTGMSDHELASLYSQCHYVSGLRRIDGFELPAAEGLLCGARPILFDRPHYRRWYDGMADFIPEGPRPQVETALIALFQRGYEKMRAQNLPPSLADRAVAVHRFDWSRISAGFWERVS